MKAINLKLVILTGAVFMMVFACKKKEETPAAETPQETPVVCFNTNNNGTYIGYGATYPGGVTTPFSSGTVTVNRTSCQVVNVTLNMGSNITETASGLVLNSSGTYEGKLANSNNVSFTFGSHLILNAVGSFSFTGVKQ